MEKRNIVNKKLLNKFKNIITTIDSDIREKLSENKDRLNIKAEYNFPKYRTKLIIDICNMSKNNISYASHYHFYPETKTHTYYISLPSIIDQNKKEITDFDLVNLYAKIIYAILLNQYYNKENNNNNIENLLDERIDKEDNFEDIDYNFCNL